MAMKQQLVRMVHMMNKLNKVLQFRRTRDSTDTFSTPLNINNLRVLLWPQEWEESDLESP